MVFMRKLLLATLVWLYAANALAIDTELCGDGVDNATSGHTKGACPTGWQDAVWGLGCDLACPYPDADADGYQADVNDCDDSNRLIYPTITVACGTDGWKTCQADGTYTTCSETELDESNSSTCASSNSYYIDSVNGNDANNGLTRATAWQHLKMFAYHYDNGTKPAGYHTLVAGDVFYLMSGTYNESYQADGPWDNTLTIRNSIGTAACPVKIKAYPGETPILTNPTGETGKPIYLYTSTDYLTIEGLTITNEEGYGSTTGIDMLEANNINIRNNKIYDIRGVDDNNLAGVRITGQQSGGHYNVTVSHNGIWDCYQADNIDINSSCVVGFRGLGDKVNYNTCYYTIEQTSEGGTDGLKWKHSDADTTLEMIGNVVYGTGRAGISSGAPNSTVSNNRIYNIGNISNAYTGSGILYADIGGGCYFDNIEISSNTIVGVKSGFSIDAISTYDTTPSDISFSNNIVIYARAADHGDSGLININAYATAAEYQYYLDNDVFSIDNNCYYNSTDDTVHAWRFCSNNDSGKEGGWASATLAAWQESLGGWDASSAYEDVELDVYQRATSTNCADKGWKLTSQETQRVTSYKRIAGRGVWIIK